MGKLTEAHVEQIRNMREDGQTYQAIREFFQKEYKIKLFDCDIARAMRGKIKTIKLKTTRRKGHIKITPVPEKAPQEGFAYHVHAAFDIHKKDFIPRVIESLKAVGVE